MTLSPEAWPRAREVFEQALAVADRSAYVAAACGSDRSLRHEVERMLESHERAAGFLSTPAAALFHETGAVQSLEGQWVGPYLVLSRIGAGVSRRGDGPASIKNADSRDTPRPAGGDFLSSAGDDAAARAEARVLRDAEHRCCARVEETRRLRG